MNMISVHSEVRIEGLETCDYLDNLCQRERFTEQGDAITFESEVSSVLSTYVKWFLVLYQGNPRLGYGCKSP